MVQYTSSGPGNRDVNHPPSPLDTFFQQNIQPTDEFTIDPAYDQFLTDRYGLQWFIPARAIRDVRGHIPHGEVGMRLSFLTDPRQALLAGYTMSSGERPLQTSALFTLQLGPTPSAYQLVDAVTLSGLTPQSNGPLSLFSATPPDIVSNSVSGMLSWKKIPRAMSSLKFGREKDWTIALPGSGTFAIAQHMPARLAHTMLTVRAYGLPVTLQEARAFLLIDRISPPIQLHQTSSLGFTGFNLPSGRAAWLLVLGVRDHHFFYGLRRLPALENRVESIALSPIQPDFLHDIIRSILL